MSDSWMGRWVLTPFLDYLIETAFAIAIAAELWDEWAKSKRYPWNWVLWILNPVPLPAALRSPP